MEYIVPSLRIVAIIEITDSGAIEEILSQLMQLEEERFPARYHQNVEKQQQKIWYDMNIKNNPF